MHCEAKRESAFRETDGGEVRAKVESQGQCVFTVCTLGYDVI